MNSEKEWIARKLSTILSINIHQLKWTNLNLEFVQKKEKN